MSITNIFVAGQNEEEVYLNAQNILNNLNGYMYSNQLHINLTKSVFIHFRPHLNSTERQTCARARVEKSLKLVNHRLKRVTEVKFLGVIIDENIIGYIVYNARGSQTRDARGSGS